VFEKLKTKWGIENNWQIVVIIMVFSLAGSSVVFLRKAYFNLLGFDANTSFWLKTIAYLLFIFPAYQVTLLAFGTLLGQFRFFWAKEKAMFKALKNIGKRQNN
jgi:hypothetical protein